MATSDALKNLFWDYVAVVVCIDSSVGSLQKRSDGGGISSYYIK